MAAGSGGVDLLTKVRKFREVDVLQHESVPNVAETLMQICKFLQEHETPSPTDCTHVVFDNYPDWWSSQKTTYKLAIAEDSTLDLLNKYISNLYDLGIPLTLTERRTAEIRFVQDVEMWGTKNAMLTAKDLLTIQSQFTRLLGQTMGEFFPNMEFLDVVIFDASGLSRTKGVMKTSLRLVWPSIVVDKERAARIRDYMVDQFKHSKDEEIRNLETQIQGDNKDNQWQGVFSDAIYMGRHGIRMPLCDRVSPAPLKKPELRPFVPHGVLRFTYAEGNLHEVEQICEGHELDGMAWLKMGCIRRDAGTPLTEWTPPVWKGERVPRSFAAAPGVAVAHGTSAARRDGGQVKIRTQGGSGEDNSRARARPRDPQRVEQERSLTFERKFEGTADEFREKLESQLGKEDNSITQEEGRLVWCQPGNTGARIEFKASNNRVYVVGKQHQIRALLNVIGPFVTEAGDARSVVTSARAGSHRLGSEHGGSAYAASAAYAPSAVYAPAAYTPSVAAASSASRGAGRDAGPGGVAEHSKRVARLSFEPQSQGEIGLKEGDHITVTHDPGPEDQMHRWVYGENEETQLRGWFPLSHTHPVVLQEAPQEQ